MSTPTTTQQMDRFEQRYEAFRAELPRQEQIVFDRLVAQARRRGNALNRHPKMDFERPAFLAMLIGTVAQQEQQIRQAERRVMQAERRLEEVTNLLAERGLALRRLPASDPELLGRLGQTRLPHHEATGFVLA